MVAETKQNDEVCAIALERIEDPHLYLSKSPTLDKIFAHQYKPKGALPPIAYLPSWAKWPLNRKLPLLKVKRDEFYWNHTLELHVANWSRGLIGKPLIPTYFHGERPEFTVINPDHVAPPYDPLHDPALVKHFRKPTVKAQLIRNKFIDDLKFVKCSQKQQNEYREYLHCAGKMNEANTYYALENFKRDCLIKRQRQLVHEQMNWASQRKKWETSLKKAKAIEAARELRIRQQHRQTKKQYDERIQALYEARHRQREDAMISKEVRRFQTLQQIMPAPVQNISETTTTIASVAVRQALASALKKTCVVEKKADNNEYKRLMWEAKLEMHERQEQLDRWAKQVMSKQRHQNIDKNIRDQINHRKNFFLRIEATKQAKKRAEYLAKKYGYIWLRKFRELSRQRNVDSAHATTFDVHRKLDHSVDHIAVHTGQQRKNNPFGGPMAGLGYKSLMAKIKQKKNDSGSGHSHSGESNKSGSP